MPPQAQPKKTRRTARCEYAEDGRRCRRDGDGTPVLCNPHKIALGDAARRAQAQRPAGNRQAGDGVFNLFDRLFSGKKINRKVVDEALHDASDIFSKVSAAQQAASEAHQQQRAGGQPPRSDPFSEWFRQQRQQQSPPPREDPSDPRSHTRIDARKKARITLEIGMRDPLSLEQISALRKALARKHHPDRPGGSVRKMQAINAAADELEVGVRAGITVD